MPQLRVDWFREALTSLACGALIGVGGCGAPSIASPDPSPSAPDGLDAAASMDASVMDATDDSLAVEDATVETTRVLIDHLSWAAYDAALDPLREHQPTQVECDDGWSVNTVSGTLDVDTVDCNYTLLAHPAGVDVAAGEVLTLRLWYFDLISAEPAHAHAALLASEQVLWEDQIPIPAPGGALDVEVAAPRDIEAGEPIRLHLHNHGQNSYLLSTVEVHSAELPIP